MKILTEWRSPGKWKLFRLDDRLLLILIGIVVGACSGVASVALNRSLAAMVEWLAAFRQIWWAFVLPGIGASLSSLFLEKITREGEGHGVPEVIYSVNRHRGLIRFRSSFSRLISACLTIGSGGSAGPEAPVVISGAAIGSNIANFFSLNDRQRIALVGCGAAGAISAIFNAPIAGMVFGMEVILGEWSAANIIPIGIASVAGTQMSRLLEGNQIPFAHRLFHLGSLDIATSVGLAVVTGLASVLVGKMIRNVHAVSSRVSLPPWVRAGIGGCAVGVIGLFLPTVLGEGYPSVRLAIEGVFQSGLLIVAVVTLAKIVATALTLGSGGSGGIFAPCLVIGSFAGLTYHRALLLLWPSVPWANEGYFALLGMAGLMSGVLQAPLTGFFLIVEITGGYEVVLPLIIVATISTTICGYLEPVSFYLKELVEKGQLLRPGTDSCVLAELDIEEVFEDRFLTIEKNMSLQDFIDAAAQQPRRHYPVVDDKTGEFLGVVELERLLPYLRNPEINRNVSVAEIMNSEIDRASPDEELKEILRRMDEKGMDSMPLVHRGKFVGMVSKARLLDMYRQELKRQTQGKDV
ncbi:MAG: chloride channel protein [Deltaproteobacteria bacterium]|nr:chloride channel protein [Deltaproteobacteria bacterium]MBW2071350.1 chloride channel protein [Deltaproteobacteria bacterium]